MQEKAISMQLGNITSKVEGLFYNNAEIIGVAGGALLVSGGVDTIMNNISKLGSNGHFPDLQAMFQALTDASDPAGKFNFDALKLYAIGWGLKEFGFGGRLGGGLQDLAKGLVVGNILVNVLHYSTN